jgi:hypothetical protein
MATAWVAEMGDGDYVSHVELDADHPFATVVNGPTGDDLPGLFAWAREAADEVRLRIGDRTFSAGVEHVEGLPHWQDTVPPPPPRPAALAEFDVLASVAWIGAGRGTGLDRCARSARGSGRRAPDGIFDQASRSSLRRIRRRVAGQPPARRRVGAGGSPGPTWRRLRPHQTRQRPALSPGRARV